jgi:hypothetical protein
MFTADWKVDHGSTQKRGTGSDPGLCLELGFVPEGRVIFDI